jgi:hypothetical protein
MTCTSPTVESATLKRRFMPPEYIRAKSADRSSNCTCASMLSTAYSPTNPTQCNSSSNSSRNIKLSNTNILLRRSAVQRVHIWIALHHTTLHHITLHHTTTHHTTPHHIASKHLTLFSVGPQRTPLNAATSSMCSRAVRSSHRMSSWGHTPMICCTCDDCVSTSKPIMNTLPWVGPISPVMMFIKVDFPVHVQDRSR